MMDVSYFQKKLQALKDSTLNEMERAAEATRPVTLDQTMIGRLSRIDAMQQQEMVLSAQRRREHLIKQINQALQRIETSEFGYCLKMF